MSEVYHISFLEGKLSAATTYQYSDLFIIRTHFSDFPENVKSALAFGPGGGCGSKTKNKTKQKNTLTNNHRRVEKKNKRGME